MAVVSVDTQVCHKHAWVPATIPWTQTSQVVPTALNGFKPMSLGQIAIACSAYPDPLLGKKKNGSSFDAGVGRLVFLSK
jgi:hypothetical protein